jgi:outer membrane protein assembly factor BamD (BamD/ComL family)
MEFAEDEPEVGPGVATLVMVDRPCSDVDSPTALQISAAMNQELLERFLSIAQRHRRDGHIERARVLFQALVDDHPGTSQANIAKAELTVLAEDFFSTAEGPTMLERLFAMAQRYRKEGNLRQASEMFWTLVDEHSETPQARGAKEELLKLAEGYERTGNQHMARGMYERLMDLED